MHVESIAKPLLERHFNDASGHVYEQTFADDEDGALHLLERKNQDEVTVHLYLHAIVDVLAKSAEATPLDDLGKLVDLDAYFAFWAKEVQVETQRGTAGTDPLKHGKGKVSGALCGAKTDLALSAGTAGTVPWPSRGNQVQIQVGAGPLTIGNFIALAIKVDSAQRSWRWLSRRRRSANRASTPTSDGRHRRRTAGHRCGRAPRGW